MKNRDSREYVRKFKNTLIRRYPIRKELSRGGDDVTFWVYDRRFKKNKIVRFFNIADMQNITTQKILDAFELLKIKEISQHPNTLKINEINVFTDTMCFDYIALDVDYFDCISLEEKAIIYIPMLERYRIIYCVLSALIHCHGSGLFHQNIGPQNIFVSKNEVKLSEPSFWVIPLHHRYSCYNQFYAPESRQDCITNAQQDIYSVGKVFKYLNLMSSDSNNVADNIIKKATACNPDDRYSSALEFREKINQLIILGDFL